MCYITSQAASYYKDMVRYRIKYFSHPRTTPSAITSQHLCFISNMKVKQTVVFYKEFSENQLIFLTDLFYLHGKLKSWSDLVKEYNINHILLFKSCQLIHALSKSWRKVITDDKGTYCNILIMNHHLLRYNHIYSLEKPNAKELYLLSIPLKMSYLHCKSTLRIFEILQSNRELYIFYLDW